MWNNKEPWVIFKQHPSAKDSNGGVYIVQATLIFDEQQKPKSVYLRRLIDGEPYLEKMNSSLDGIEWSISFSSRTQSTHVRYLVEWKEKTCWLNATGFHAFDITDAEDFSLRVHVSPEWFTEAVAYEIFIDRFASSSNKNDVPDWARRRDWGSNIDNDRYKNAYDLFGGDLRGVTEHLPYLANLGISLIYLTPFFLAESAHRYDVIDFNTVDPFIGGEAALAQLIQRCHQHGIRVIGDVTLNHTSWHHSWFIDAFNESSQRARERYYFNKDNESYVCWDDLPHLPKLNWKSSDLEEDMISSLTRFVGPEFGLDGWRIDAANMVGRYLDSDVSAHIISRVWRECTDVNPNAIVIAEHNHDASRLVEDASFDGLMNYVSVARPLWAWLADTPCDGFFGYPATMHKIRGEDLVKCCRGWEAAYGVSILKSNLNVISSHDTPRMASLWKHHPERTAAALGYLFAYPGVPMILYGEECQYEGKTGELGRVTFNGDTASEIVELIHDLAHVRRVFKVLSDGDLRWIYAADNAVAFIRFTNKECLLSFISRGGTNYHAIKLHGLKIDSIHVIAGNISARLMSEQIVFFDGEAGFSYVEILAK